MASLKKGLPGRNAKSLGNPQPRLLNFVEHSKADYRGHLKGITPMDNMLAEADPRYTCRPDGWGHLSAEQITKLGIFGLMIAAGLSVIPIANDGTKKPALRGGWKAYQQRHASPVEALDWSKRQLGYAVICGAISYGIEVIDFDDGSLWNAWYFANKAILTRHQLPIVATPSGGFHVYYRCREIAGNLKLAKAEDGATLIETRGDGGYVLGPWNPRPVHPAGRLYLPIGGHQVPNIPAIEPEERKQLLKAAAGFDRYGLRKQHVEKEARRRRAEEYRQNGKPIVGLSAWDDFKVRASWPQVLEPHGWTQADGDFWTRPGGDIGAHSASIKQSAQGPRVLIVFSSNAGPLAPTTGDHATWDLFSAFAALNHGGDRRAAARELRKAGYGG